MKGLLLLGVIILISVDLCFAVCKCDNKDLPNAGNCTLKAHVCGCLRSITKFQYQATVTEQQHKKSAQSGWHDSSTSAGDEAALDLFNKVLGPSDCSCSNISYPVGNCTFRFDICFMFNNTQCMTSKLPSYKAWATDIAHQRTGNVVQYATPQSAATAAATQIFQKYPDEAKLCGMGTIMSVVEQEKPVTPELLFSSDDVDHLAYRFKEMM